jgi:ubiquinone/menaquinone biosynthesis C-methylase UbiE
MTAERTLSVDEARAFYDRLGRRQDWQRFFEDPAIETMIAHGGFQSANAVLEFGCGTGRIAEHLLNDLLPSEARYLALDTSPTMIGLARKRLERFGARARVRQTDGSIATGEPDASIDRFVSNYVLDLMSRAQIAALLDEARRVLTRDGLLCLVSLTNGRTAPGRLFSRAWSRVHRFDPKLVGGCRPIELLNFIDHSRWEIVYCQAMSSFLVTSEILIASPRAPAQGAAAP